jgi:hypothetical protein
VQLLKKLFFFNTGQNKSERLFQPSIFGLQAKRSSLSKRAVTEKKVSKIGRKPFLSLLMQRSQKRKKWTNERHFEEFSTLQHYDQTLQLYLY